MKASENITIYVKCGNKRHRVLFHKSGKVVLLSPEHRDGKDRAYIELTGQREETCYRFVGGDWLARRSVMKEVVPKLFNSGRSLWHRRRWRGYGVYRYEGWYEEAPQEMMPFPTRIAIKTRKELNDALQKCYGQHILSDIFIGDEVSVTSLGRDYLSIRVKKTWLLLKRQGLAFHNGNVVLDADDEMLTVLAFNERGEPRLVKLRRK